MLIDPCPIAIAPQIGFVAGVALVQAVADLGVEGAALRWPNDLLWRGAKVAGLLVEGMSIARRRLACAVGIGANCASAPDGLAYPTTDLFTALVRPVFPGALFDRLGARFDEALSRWRAGAGFADIRALWLANAAGLGGSIRIVGPRNSSEGLFEGLDEDGRLMLRGREDLERFALQAYRWPHRLRHGLAIPPTKTSGFRGRGAQQAPLKCAATISDCRNRHAWRVAANRGFRATAIATSDWRGRCRR